MKRQVLPYLLSGVMVFSALPLVAQRNPRGTEKLTLQGKAVTMEYGRPSLNGRSVQDLLANVPAGGFWRLGADKSTTFSTEADLAFGDATVPKGEYSLWVGKQDDGSWKLVFNKQTGQWGTEHDAAQDLVAVPLRTTKAYMTAERVYISFGEADDGGAWISISWGDRRLFTKFKAK